MNRSFISLLTAGLVIALAGDAMAQTVEPANVAPIVYSGHMQGRLLSAHNNYTQAGVSVGLFGESKGLDGRGVVGLASAPSGNTFGVIGRNYSPAGGGVYGHAHNGAGDPSGVVAISEAQGGRGVFAEARHPSGINFGVFARSYSTQGRGVVGVASATTGVNYGVIGRSLSSEGVGVWAHAPAQTGTPVALRAQVGSLGGTALVAINERGGTAARFEGHVDIRGALKLDGELFCYISHDTQLVTLDAQGSGQHQLWYKPINFVVTPMDQAMPYLHYYSVEMGTPMGAGWVTPTRLHIAGGVPGGRVNVTALKLHCPGTFTPQ